MRCSFPGREGSKKVVLATALIVIVAGLIDVIGLPAAVRGQAVDAQRYGLAWGSFCASSLATLRGDDTGARDFALENDAAMTAMMRGMTVAPTGSIDSDFATMMIAHHQGAVDMALAELRHGSNERLRRLAQGIVVEQRQEIAAMQLVLDQELAPHGTGPSATPPGAAPASAPARATITHNL